MGKGGLICISWMWWRSCVWAVLILCNTPTERSCGQRVRNWSIFEVQTKEPEIYDRKRIQYSIFAYKKDASFVFCLYMNQIYAPKIDRSNSSFSPLCATIPLNTPSSFSSNSFGVPNSAAIPS